MSPVFDDQIRMENQRLIQIAEEDIMEEDK
jgi:hypothetical protein